MKNPTATSQGSTRLMVAEGEFELGKNAVHDRLCLAENPP
jgi:hypothetical protein